LGKKIETTTLSSLNQQVPHDLPHLHSKLRLLPERENLISIHHVLHLGSGSKSYDQIIFARISRISSYALLP
jgi:hypothetical protein